MNPNTQLPMHRIPEEFASPTGYAISAAYSSAGPL